MRIAKTDRSCRTSLRIGLTSALYKTVAVRFRFIVDKFSLRTGCCIFSGDCSCCTQQGNFYWTAGQRIDPSRNTTFIWRMKSTDTYGETVSQMSYSNWEPGQPSGASHGFSCLYLWSGRSYLWKDGGCGTGLCSICEIDI